MSSSSVRRRAREDSASSSIASRRRESCKYCNLLRIGRYLISDMIDHVVQRSKLWRQLPFGSPPPSPFQVKTCILELLRHYCGENAVRGDENMVEFCSVEHMRKRSPWSNVNVKILCCPSSTGPTTVALAADREEHLVTLELLRVLNKAFNNISSSGDDRTVVEDDDNGDSDEVKIEQRYASDVTFWLVAILPIFCPDGYGLTMIPTPLPSTPPPPPPQQPSLEVEQ